MERRLRIVLPAFWAGVLACIALVAAPAPFATLIPRDAGRVVARIFVQEAYFSVLMAVLLLLIERRAAQAEAAAGRGSLLSTNMLLVLGTLLCTIAGYFVLQPMIVAARAGQGALPFAVLHGASAGFFALKTLLVIALAWRVSRPSS